MQYAILDEEPYNKEQELHRHFEQYREGKEWFRLSPEEIVVIIRDFYDNEILLEDKKYLSEVELHTIAQSKKQKDYELQLLRQQKEEQKRLQIEQQWNYQRERDSDILEQSRIEKRIAIY